MDGNGKKKEVEVNASGTEEKTSEVHEEQKKKKKKEEIIEELRQKLEESQKESEQLKERLLYQQADFENFKKLKAKEKQDALKYGNETLVKELLPVIDNLERAVEHASKTEDSRGIVEGVELTLGGFLKALEKFGVTRVEAKGKEFDPNVHEAVAQEPSNEKAPGTIITELQKGYVMHGRLLRPAMVTVAKSPEAD
jgi:molecular chaperone GrpE